jgi:hypothetical protein
MPYDHYALQMEELELVLAQTQKEVQQLIAANRVLNAKAGGLQSMADHAAYEFPEFLSAHLASVRESGTSSNDQHVAASPPLLPPAPELGDLADTMTYHSPLSTTIVMHDHHHLQQCAIPSRSADRMTLAN